MGDSMAMLNPFVHWFCGSIIGFNMYFYPVRKLLYGDSIFHTISILSLLID